MRARVNGDLVAVKDGQQLTYRDGEVVTGDVAAYLIRTGAAVTADDADAEKVAAEVADNDFAGRDEIGEVQQDPTHKGPKGRPPYGTAIAPEGAVPDPRRDVSTGFVDANNPPPGVVVNKDGTVSDTAQRTVPDTPAEFAGTPETTGDDTPDAGAQPGADAKIDDVLAWVGDDITRAGQAKTVEESKGDKARSRLIAKLDDIGKGDTAH